MIRRAFLPVLLSLLLLTALPAPALGALDFDGVDDQVQVPGPPVSYCGD